MMSKKTTTTENVPVKTPVADKPPRKLWLPQSARPRRPVLRFTPTAWAKLEFFRDRGDTEIGGFGITAPHELLLIEEFITVRQTTTGVSVAFDDAAVADFFEAQVDAGRKPEQFGRLWLHTHPGDSPTPSGTDEHTFIDVFGRCAWAVMFVLAHGGQTYARLRFNVGPGGDVLIPTDFDFARPFAGSDHAAWAAEYDRNIQSLALTDLGLDSKRNAAKPAALDALAATPGDPDQELLAALESGLDWGLGLDEAEAFLGAAESGVWP
jgi:hypothetical protein